MSKPQFRALVGAAALSLVFSAALSAELTPNPDHVVGKAVNLQVDSYNPEKGMIPVDLTLDDGSAENSIGDSGQFIWLNRFTPDPADFPFQIEQVSGIIGTTLVNVGDPIEIVIYSDTDNDGDPGTGSALVASISETVQFNDLATFNVWNLVTPVVLSGPGDVLVGLINRAGAEGTDDFPAALDQTTTAQRSWAATYLAGDAPVNPPLPGDEQWGTIDSFGFAGNWVVRAAGTTIAPAVPVIEVPTQSHTGLMAFGLLLVLAAVVVIWRRSA